MSKPVTSSVVYIGERQENDVPHVWRDCAGRMRVPLRWVDWARPKGGRLAWNTEVQARSIAAAMLVDHLASVALPAAMAEQMFSRVAADLLWPVLSTHPRGWRIEGGLLVPVVNFMAARLLDGKTLEEQLPADVMTPFLLVAHKDSDRESAAPGAP